MGEIMCECCKVNKARVKDYRNEGHIIQKHFVCRLCFNLADEDFFRMLGSSEEEKKELIREIIEEWGLEGYHDEKDPILNEEIQNWLKFVGKR